MSLQERIAGRALGRDAGPVLVHDVEGNRLVCAHMLEQARRDLCLLTRDLDKPVFDQPRFLAALRRLALRSRFSRIRILLQDHERVVKQGHRIIELTRRLVSSIEVRTPSEEWQDLAENYLLADGDGYVRWEHGTRYEAMADYHAPLVVRPLQARFDEIWESAEVSSELRRLYL
jgi:hypothetical protein